MSRRAVYTGSFDPITLGHLNVIERSSQLVRRVDRRRRHRTSTSSRCSRADERVELIRRVTKRLGNVVVKQFEGLAVQFVRECDARVIIRGVRSLSDIEAEFTMTLANRKLDPDIETVFLMADEEYSHVSSSLIKQITPMASDEELARFVPTAIIPDLRADSARNEGEVTWRGAALADGETTAEPTAAPDQLHTTARRTASDDLSEAEPVAVGHVSPRDGSRPRGHRRPART